LQVPPHWASIRVHAGCPGRGAPTGAATHSPELLQTWQAPLQADSQHTPSIPQTGAVAPHSAAAAQIAPALLQ
jgi:hypothetical protein